MEIQYKEGAKLIQKRELIPIHPQPFPWEN